MIVKLEDFSEETIGKLNDPGLLLVGAKKDGKTNVMTISWGFIGFLWGKPVFITAVRPSRFTQEFIEETGEFTVNVPRKGMEKTVSYCGEVTGRKHDKLRERRLSLIAGKKVKCPVIRQCKIHYECKVIYRLKVKRDLVPSVMRRQFYPKGDYHTLYFGQILAAY